MAEKVRKEEVEQRIGTNISDKDFQMALTQAEHKQEYIYSREHRLVVMQDWYLTELTVEYVISLAFSKMTQDICNILRNMEKEHLVEDQDALEVNHIVAV
jgi:hypothetical protein